MSRSRWVWPLVFTALFSTAGAQETSQPRLTIANNCHDDVWAVLTPGGNPAQVAALQNSGGWFRQYAQREHFIDLGVTGTIASGSTTLKLSGMPPNPPFIVAGQIVRVTGAGPGNSNLVSTIDEVENQDTVLILNKPAQTTVFSADVQYDTRQGAVLIPANTRQVFDIPDGGAPGANFRFFMGCPSLAQNDKPFGSAGCVIGAAAGDLSGINTLFEPTFGCVQGIGTCAFNPAGSSAACQTNPTAATCPPLNHTDYYDISAVDGYTLPMTVKADGTDCSAPVKDASMLDLASCPSENERTLYSLDREQQSEIRSGIGLLTASSGYLKACAAPYKWFELATVGSPANSHPTQPDCPAGSRNCTSVSYYAGAGCDTAHPRLFCPGNSGPQQRVGPQQNGRLAIHNTHFVRQLYALGYTGYTWQYGDGVGAQQCRAGATFTLTLCPSGGRPYQRQNWAFDATTGACSLAAGDGGQTRLYPSLAACQHANMRYVCDPLTKTDPFHIPGALWRASARATRTGQGYTYAGFRGLAQLVCADVPVDIPGYPQIRSEPSCAYYYGGSELCPADGSLH